jgi:hypothetical protein
MDPKQGTASSSGLFEAPVKLELSSTGTLQVITVSNVGDFDKIAARFGSSGDGRAAKRQRTEDVAILQLSSPTQPPPAYTQAAVSAAVSAAAPAAASAAAPAAASAAAPAAASAAAPAAASRCDTDIDELIKIIRISRAGLTLSVAKLDGIWYDVRYRGRQYRQLFRVPEMSRLKHRRALQCACGQHVLVLYSVTAIRYMYRLGNGESLEGEAGATPTLLNELHAFGSVNLTNSVALFDELGL